MPRINITIPDPVYELLKAESLRTHVPIAELVRQYIDGGLIAAGHTPPAVAIQWGGKRSPKKK